MILVGSSRPNRTQSSSKASLSAGAVAHRNGCCRVCTSSYSTSFTILLGPGIFYAKLSIYGSTTLVKSPLSNVNSVQSLRLFGEASRAGRRRLRRRCSSICAEPCVRAAAMAAESSFDFLDLNMLTTIAKTPGCLSGWPARQLEYQGPQCYWQRHLCHPGALWISSGQP